MNMFLKLDTCKTDMATEYLKGEIFHSSYFFDFPVVVETRVWVFLSASRLLYLRVIESTDKDQVRQMGAMYHGYAILEFVFRFLLV